MTHVFSSFHTLMGIALLSGTIISSSVFAFNPEINLNDIGGREDTRAIEYLRDSGVVQGYQDNTYKPEQSISRAEFTKIIVKTASLEIKKCTKTDVKKVSTVFSDVSTEDWFAEDICRAYMTGLIKGYTDGTFKPHQEITLSEAAKIVTLAQESDINLSHTGEWYEKYTEALDTERALNPHLIEGNTSPINRGVMADLVWRLQTGNEVYETNEPQILNSCIALEDQIEKMNKRNNGGRMMQFGGGEIDEEIQFDMMTSESMPMPATSAPLAKSISSSAESGASDDFSQTNIQEQGVDEMDVIKNDGSHIFYARGENVKIIKAYPQSEMKEEATITIDNMYATDLMLENDTLIVIGNRTYSASNNYSKRVSMESSMPFYNNGGVEVRIFDISDRTNPKEIRSVSLDGSLVSSRRVGNTLYLINNNYLYNYSRGNPLPMIIDSDLEYSIAPECGNISYFPNFQGNNLMTVAAVDISNPLQKITLENYLGAGSQVYASPDNLYIVQQDSQQLFEDENGVARWTWEEVSNISKFSLSGLNINFKSLGTVPGRVLNQYSMSEYEDNFRIATTQAWGNNRENFVYILDENMQELGSISGIAPEEEIKSVRFMEDRGFVVTFKSVDPLFVIDMTPENPKILGELKIPGWSDYLHPISEDYLLGFGKEVNPESENNDRLTWDMLMGMKMSIFDVSDLENPKEIHKEVIGERGTESELLHNPKALFFDAERQLVGFPIRIQEKIKSVDSCTMSNDLVCSEGCVPGCEPCKTGEVCTKICKIQCVPERINEYDEYETTFVGAHLYNFDVNNGFELQGSVSHFPENTQNYWDQNYQIQRLVRMGENMYSVSKGIIKGLDMNMTEQTKISFLGELSCNQIQDQDLCSDRSDCEVEWYTPWCETRKLCIQVSEFGGCRDK